MHEVVRPPSSAAANTRRMHRYEDIFTLECETIGQLDMRFQVGSNRYADHSCNNADDCYWIVLTTKNEIYSY